MSNHGKEGTNKEGVNIDETQTKTDMGKLITATFDSPTLVCHGRVLGVYLNHHRCYPFLLADLPLDAASSIASLLLSSSVTEDSSSISTVVSTAVSNALVHSNPRAHPCLAALAHVFPSPGMELVSPAVGSIHTPPLSTPRSVGCGKGPKRRRKRSPTPIKDPPSGPEIQVKTEPGLPVKPPHRTKGVSQKESVIEISSDSDPNNDDYIEGQPDVVDSDDEEKSTDDFKEDQLAGSDINMDSPDPKPLQSSSSRQTHTPAPAASKAGKGKAPVSSKCSRGKTTVEDSDPEEPRRKLSSLPPYLYTTYGL
jgi:hypothetical protein